MYELTEKVVEEFNWNLKKGLNAQKLIEEATNQFLLD